MAKTKPVRTSMATNVRPPNSPPAVPRNGNSRLATFLIALPSKTIGRNFARLVWNRDTSHFTLGKDFA